MKLSIIIVNYNSTLLVQNLLQSVYRFVHQIHFELIIVDNSNDVSARDLIVHQYPAIKWINMQQNAGFSRANNAGIRQASGNVLLLLNPDTLVVDDSIQNSFQRLCNSAYVAAGVQLLNEQLEPQISGSRFMFWGLNHLLPLPYYGNFIRWLGYKAGTKAPGIEKVANQVEVDWISGAFLMVKKEVIEAVGMLDEDFFLYAEEVEWCRRIRKKGKLCLYGDLKIIHLEGTTTAHASENGSVGYYNLFDKKGLQLMVSNHVRVRKQYGVVAFLFLLINYTFGLFVFAIIGFFQRLFSAGNVKVHGARVVAFAKNLAVLWKLAPTILRNKPHFYKMF